MLPEFSIVGGGASSKAFRGKSPRNEDKIVKQQVFGLIVVQFGFGFPMPCLPVCQKEEA